MPYTHCVKLRLTIHWNITGPQICKYNLLSQIISIIIIIDGSNFFSKFILGKFIFFLKKRSSLIWYFIFLNSNFLGTYFTCSFTAWSTCVRTYYFIFNNICIYIYVPIYSISCQIKIYTKILLFKHCSFYPLSISSVCVSTNDTYQFSFYVRFS